jgi:hypothetical protein
MPGDHDQDFARQWVLEAVTEFLEAIDTANRMLNAVSPSVLEPLSEFTGGTRWDVRTRRTLKEIHADVSVLRSNFNDISFLLSIRGLAGEAEFDEIQSKLERFSDELGKRVFDLKCLPDHPTDPTDASISQLRATQEAVANPNGNTERDSNSDVMSSRTENPNETDEKLPKRVRKDSPSRVKAKAAYDYAMQRISNAHAMTAVELFDAIREDGEAKEMLPPTAESFTKYLNDCGIRLRKSDTKPTGRSVVRRSDT